MKTYKININKNANGSSEIKSFDNLKDAYAFFIQLNTDDLEETNGESDEYELLSYLDNELQDWSNNELEEIDWKKNTWVTKTKRLPKTPHENALILIKVFEYNARQVSQVLGVTTQTIDKKIKLVNNNKFSESDFQKLIFHFQ